MSIISIPFTFSAGAVIIASQHNSNFSTILNDYNGNIDNTNISGTAAIAYTKLNLSGGIVNADVNASAAIADSKLATISTASKVSGAALTSLANTPSGAGVFPVANLGTGANSTNFLCGDGTFKTSGSIALVSNTPVSATNNSGDIAITNTKYYMVVAQITAVAANDTISLRVNNDTGGTKYRYVVRGFDFAANAGNLASAGDSSLYTGNPYPNGSGNSYNILFYIFPQCPSNNTFYVNGSSWGDSTLAGVYTYSNFFGMWQASGAATSFRIMSVGGQTFNANISLYEIKQA
jgi:hypothetical protein